jgi:hypothetical protein
MGERLALGLRVTKEVKQKLNQASYLSGRSQSQEAEFRLEQTFNANRTLFDALDLAYGRRWTGLILALAHAAQMTGTRAMSVNYWNFSGGEEWVSDPYAYDQAVKAVNTILEAFRPKGKIKIEPVYDFARLPAGMLEKLGEEFAEGLLAQLKQPNPEVREAEIVTNIVQRLTDLIPKMRLPPK